MVHLQALQPDAPDDGAESELAKTAVRDLAPRQEGHDSLVVEGCVLPMHGVSGVRHHHLQFSSTWPRSISSGVSTA
jgi:hypothetical protein